MTKEKTEAVNPNEVVNDVLEKAKDKYPLAIVVGLLPDGNLDLTTNAGNYQLMHWLLNRALLEITLHERDIIARRGVEEKAA